MMSRSTRARRRGPFRNLKKAKRTNVAKPRSIRRNTIVGVKEKEEAIEYSSSGGQIVFDSILNPVDGYGSSAEQMAIHLAEQVPNLKFVPQQSDAAWAKFVDSRMGKLLKAQPASNPEAYLGYYAPNSHASLPSLARRAKRRYLYTTWETTQPPRGWKYYINKFDKLFVSSHFCHEGFKNLGVKIPIEVIPLGVNTAAWPYMERSIDGPLTFLMMANSDFNDKRKNYRAGVEAFKKAFGNSSDAKLVIKTTCGGLQRVEIVGDHTNIEYIEKRLTQEQLLMLFKRCHAYLCPTRGEGYGLVCYPPGTLLNTPDGAQEIETFDKGDVLYSHTGNTREVTGATCRDYSGELIKLKPRYSDPLEQTPNHELLVVARPKKLLKSCRKHLEYVGFRPRWIPASKVEEKDFLCVPKITIEKEPITIDLTQHVAGLEVDKEHVYYKMSFKQVDGALSYSKIAKVLEVSINSIYYAINNLRGPSKRKTKVLEYLASSSYKKPEHIKANRYQDLDKELMFFFGLYLAEGSVSENAVSISSHDKEKENHQNCKQIAERFNGTYWYRDNCEDGGHKAECVISSKLLAQLCGNLFGKGAYNKRIPGWMLSSDSLYSLIAGYYYGDGSKAVRNACNIGSASRLLLESIRIGLNSYGIFSGIKDEHRKNRREFYTLSIPGSFIPKFKELTGSKLNYEPFDRKTPIFILEDDSYYYVEVASKSSVSYDGKVYNLHVDKDESYLVNSFSAHNCREAMTTGMPVIAACYSGMQSVMSLFANYQVDFELETVNISDCQPCMQQIFADNNGGSKDLGEWANPSISSMASIMKKMLVNKLEVLERGKEASEWVRGNETYELTAKKLLNAMEMKSAATI